MSSYDPYGLGITAELAGDAYKKSQDIGGLGKFIKWAGPIGMGAGIGLDVLDRFGVFGESAQEKRQKWIEGLIAKAGQEYERGLRSSASRFARARTLSDVDRQAGALRSGGSGRATRVRSRLTTGLGAAGRLAAESVGGAVEGSANFDASALVSAILSQLNAQSDAAALEEAKGRQASVLAGIYSQPLQDDRSQDPRRMNLQEPLGNALDYLGAYYNARNESQGTKNRKMFF